MQPRPASGLGRVVAPLAVLAGLLSGCDGLIPAPRTQPGQFDRLMAAYPDSASGRFWVLADFEQIKHYSLFHVFSHSGRAECSASLNAGVADTGRRCLRVTLADPLDALLIDNEHAQEWALKRDWREFRLLLLAIHSSADATPLELSLEAGPEGRGVIVQSRSMLHKGWNVLRLDLAEAAENLPLDQMRRIRLSLPEAQEPTELLLDDLLLIDNRRDVFGSFEDLDQGLYVRREGRRWNVGAAGRFELGLAHGQIVHWYDLGHDPHRLENLVAGTVLGPSPVVLPLPDDPDANGVPGFEDLGSSVIARQRLVEANAVRIVVECTWQYADPNGSIPDQAAGQSWTYTILRDGRVYVHVESPAPGDGFEPEAMGLWVSMRDDGSLEATAHSTGQLADPEDLRHVAYAYARPASADRSGVSVTLHDSRQGPKMSVRRQPQRRRLGLLASGGALAEGRQHWSCLLRVWPPGHCDETVDLALDYCYPEGVEVGVGEWVLDAPGDADGDGFDERAGCYTFRPEGDLLRFVLDGSRRPRFSPVFKVLGTGDHRVWVYVDNVILEPLVRNAAGEVLFQLPMTVRHRCLVEVVLRREAEAPQP
ncbi:MAG: hypothetical protein IID40_07630 [Planctomycetes bacterium]|nr:hypothetical protein [Planctomycetota bacterium]